MATETVERILERERAAQNKIDEAKATAQKFMDDARKKAVADREQSIDSARIRAKELLSGAAKKAEEERTKAQADAAVAAEKIRDCSEKLKPQAVDAVIQLLFE